MKKILPFFIIGCIAVGIVAFYGGMEYQKKNKPRDGAFVQNRGDRERSRDGMTPRGGRFGGGANGGITVGEIVAKDDKSITVKLRDGGSIIVLYAPTVEVTKSVSGTPDDLVVGATITVQGVANADGSVTAESIQLRPLR